MTITGTDLFCGAGGSSLGAQEAGMTLMMAANHWQLAVDVHQSHFPNAGHDCADISQADPRRYPVTDILLASPECTNHSQARGVSRKRQDPTLWDSPDPTAERSRATMWDVVRFAEQIAYKIIIVENVVEAIKWTLFPAWWQAMESLGYSGRIISANSMHHNVPQSRDRIYVMWAKRGIKLNTEREHIAHCTRCERINPCRQAFKNGRRVGRYRQQWVWSCTSCHHPVEPATLGAETIIDWSLNCPRIGDRKTPLAQNTLDRVLAGLQRYGYVPITTSGAGNGFERTPGNRARPTTDPVATQTTTGGSALALPPGFLFQTAHGGRPSKLDQPHPTVTASDDRQALVVPLRRNSHASAPNEPIATVTAGGNHHALVMRNNTGGAEMVTPTDEPMRTLTTITSQSLLLPYNKNSRARQVTEPASTVTTRDRLALLDAQAYVMDCGLRMLEPYEAAGAMAFPVGYIPRDLNKRDQMKLAGNAVTPPVMQWLVGCAIEALAS